MTSLCAPLPADAGDSVTLIIGEEEPAISWPTSKHRINGDQQYERYRKLHAAERPALPRIQPGQLWVVEQSSPAPDRPPLVHMPLPRPMSSSMIGRSIRSSLRTCRSAVTPSPRHCRIKCPTGRSIAASNL